MRSLTGVCLLILFSACADSDKVPAEFIQKEKMQRVMWDMIQADRYTVDFLPRPGDSAYDETAILKVYQKVFNVHGITRDDFLKSYKFYLNHPNITKVIYDSISAQAGRRREEVFKPKVDSLNKDSLQKDSVMGSLRMDSIKRDSLRSRPLIDTLRKQRLDSIRNRLRKK